MTDRTPQLKQVRRQLEQATKAMERIIAPDITVSPEERDEVRRVLERLVSQFDSLKVPE